MIGFTYVCLLIVFIIFISYLINNNQKYSPKKIKPFFLIVLSLLLLKFVALAICLIFDQQFIIYAIKPLVFLNLICVPLLALGCFYIFLRDDKKKFDYNYSFLIIGVVAFICFVIFVPLGISIKQYFGYIISMNEPMITSILYMIVLASLCVCTLYYFDKPFCNKSGMRLLFCSIVISIAEYFVFLGGIRVYPYPLIGEAFMLISTMIAINKFVKNHKSR